MLKTIQFDIKNKRVFLKKCEYPNLQLKDVFVGAVLNVYSRQLKIIDFADEFTRSKF
jgi:nucleoside-diphosphate kinase